VTLPRASERRLDELVGHAELALAAARAAGADHAEVGVGQGRELEVSVRSGEVELLKEAQSQGLSIRVIIGDRVATSATTDLAPEALRRFAATAVEMASVSEPDPLAAPPEPKELARSWRELDLFDPRTDRITADKGIKQALRAERAAFAHDSRITTSEGASFSRSSGHSVLLTSGGFCGRTAGTYQSLVVQAIADDVDGKKRNGSFWTGARFLEDLESPVEVGREAARRAVRTLGSTQMPTGVYPVVFDHEAARAVVGLVASCISGDAVYRHRSYLAGRLGQTVASAKVTIVDDPFVPRGPGSRAYDGEGRRARRNTIISRGELKSYLLDSYSARKLGLAPTGSAGGGGGIPHCTTSNFYLEAGRASPESLLRGIDRGLYVTKMMGFGFDATTGNFSRGAEGFLIEGGELAGPVGEITISRNLDDLLQGIDAVASNLEFKTSVASPSFRVDEMTIAGR
jgi:PmbA protein